MMVCSDLTWLFRDVNCLLCQGMPETSQHLFMDCSYTTILFDGLSWPITRSWHDLLCGRHIVGNVRKVEKLVIYLAYSVLFYAVWSERNSPMYQVEAKWKFSQTLFS